MTLVSKLISKLAGLFLLCLLPVGLKATTYTVKAGGGGSYTTISACAAVAVAGDTCVVYAGTYAGWTQPTSGSAGSPITFTINTGDTVNVSSQINISGRSYITISYFTSIIGGILGDGSSSHEIITHNSFSGTASAFRINDGQGSNGSDNLFSYNNVTTGQTGNVVGVYLYGDRNHIEHNELVGTDGDCMDVGGANVVVRDNYCHNVDGAISGEHIDFIQVIGGGTAPTLSFSLVERNVEQNCTNDGTNCHFIIVRTGTGPVADTVIVRYNFAQNLDGSGVSLGGVGDSVPNAWVYNNTFATGTESSETGDCASWQNATAGGAFNNICYNSIAGPYSPFYSTTSDLAENANLVYTGGYSSTWNSPYSGEATYASLHNVNPLFANYPTDGTLQSGSPARGAGVALTTVAAGDSGSGTSLIVNNAHGFQPGWAGTNADWIRVGASTTVQIASINYSTNTITLASGISRSSGNPVYLYKDSNGTVVLSGSLPDIGAYPYASAGAPAVTLSSGSIGFGNQTVSTTSGSQSVTVTNSGTATLNISSITVTGTNSADFSKTTTCGATLTASNTCSISVTFTPSALGARSASVSIADDASDTPQAITLTGTGVAAAVSVPSGWAIL